MTDKDLTKQFVDRMGSCTWDDIRAEQAWTEALCEFQKANAALMLHLANRVREAPGFSRTAPVREQLSELSGGTWLVARFDHSAELAAVVDQIINQPVGFLG